MKNHENEVRETARRGVTRPRRWNDQGSGESGSLIQFGVEGPDFCNFRSYHRNAVWIGWPVPSEVVMVVLLCLPEPLKLHNLSDHGIIIVLGDLLDGCPRILSLAFVSIEDYASVVWTDIVPLPIQLRGIEEGVEHPSE